VEEWIRPANAAGIGKMTFLTRLTTSDEERQKALSEILAKESEQRR
jgi:hypothetical protein